MLTTAKEAIEAIRTVANQEAKKQLSNIEVTNFAQIVKDNGDNTYDIQIYGGDTVYPHIISKTIDKIVVGDSVIVKSIGGNTGNGYIAYRVGKSQSYKFNGDVIMNGDIYNNDSVNLTDIILDCKISQETINKYLNLGMTGTGQTGGGTTPPIAGTNNYNDLLNIPTINGVSVTGDKQCEDYDIQREMSTLSNSELEEMLNE